MMMHTIEDTQYLSKLWLVSCVCNAVIMTIFFVIMFSDNNDRIADVIFPTVGFASVLGIISGLYIKYRTDYSSLYSIVIINYFIILMEILLGGSTLAFAVLLGGYYDLRWFAFASNLASVIITLLVSMVLAAKELHFWDETNSWRHEIEKYIDYSTRRVNPALTGDTVNYKKVQYPYLITAVGVVNIPLLFQIYGGGRENAVLLAAPMLLLTFSYLNFKTFGPALVRILLLRKIEKEFGYRFQNADYEKIQELRCGFFEARWLMKDYRPPQTQATAWASGIQKDNVAKKKKRKRGT